jgi:hypothetical protein
LKAKLLQLLGVALLIVPIAAHCAPAIFAFTVDGGPPDPLAGQSVAPEADALALFAIGLGLLLSLKRRRRALARAAVRVARKRASDRSLVLNNRRAVPRSPTFLPRAKRVAGLQPGR